MRNKLILCLGLLCAVFAISSPVRGDECCIVPDNGGSTTDFSQIYVRQEILP